MTTTERLVDQLRRSAEGEAWLVLRPLDGYHAVHSVLLRRAPGQGR